MRAMRAVHVRQNLNPPICRFGSCLVVIIIKRVVCFAGTLLYVRSRAVNLARKGDIERHYMLVWQLFYSEYLLFPFVV